MKNKYLLNTVLALTLFAALMTCLIVRVILPAAILPGFSIPNMVLISLIALIIEHAVNPGAPRCYICIPVLSVITFGLLPLMAGFACIHDFWKIGLAGGLVFTLTTFVFTSMADRLSTGPKARAALVMGCVGIWLASQAFIGMM